MSSDNGNLGGQKRKSRFDEEVVDPVLPEQKRLNLEVSVAAAKAAEMSKEIAARMKLVTSLLGVNKGTEKKAAYRPLLLDAQGREIDEHGNLVKHEIQLVKTLAANVAASQPPKKKENPYLAHRSHAPSEPSKTLIAASNTSAQPLTTSDSSTPAEPPSSAEIIVDERIPEKRRELKAKKALQFVEAGKYIKEANKLAEKEERKMIAGYSSGRKQLEKATSSTTTTSNNPEEGQMVVEETSNEPLVPPVLDPIVPTMEWWDEAFLPKTRRDTRKISKAACEQDEYDACNIQNIKTYKFIQHPIPLKPLGDTKTVPILPMYLTKKERKKLRKSQRAEREKEKRDKMMLGLLPTPEPKFKLSNFMKLLGDQAVADPSKIEMKVVQQMQKRILNHEMRNQMNKLTPQQKRSKKMKKLQEDLSKGVTVAIFRITDFSCLKYRFKVDITAQQYFLSGLVLLCPDEKLNLVVVEGGPKGIRKFVKLLTQRIQWNVFIPTNTIVNDEEGKENGEDFQVITSGEEFNYHAVNGEHQDTTEEEEGVGQGEAGNEEEENKDEVKENEDDDSDSDSDSEDEEDERSASLQGSSSAVVAGSRSSGGGAGGLFEPVPNPDGRCDLLWQGILPKRLFTGFKFQEVKSSSAAKKLLEGKNVSHYWDMVQHAQAILDSSKSDDIFDLLNL
eukprot:gene8368-9054_t